MLLKYTLKNMLERPLRLIVLLFCIMTASIAAFLMLDMGNSLKMIFQGFATDYMGNSDYYVTYEKGLADEMFAECPAADIVYTEFAGKRESRREEQLYSYVFSDDIEIMAFSDLNAAYRIGILPEPLNLTDAEIAIGSKYSQKYGYTIGDTITLTDYTGETFGLTVAAIFTERGFVGGGGELTAATTIAAAERLNGTVIYSMAFVDVLNDDYTSFETALQSAYPDIEIEPVYMNDEMQQSINNLNAVLALVFVLTFLLVIFVTVSFSEKIITERMSVIGTLRSIGISRRKTTCILMLENALYGIIGSLLGLLIYLLLRPLILDNFSVASSENTTFDPRTIAGHISPLICFIVIAGAVCIELLVPLAETLHAVKTPIRDIIFGGKDTEYQISYVKTVIGAMMLMIGILSGLSVLHSYQSIMAVLLLVVGMAFSAQFVSKGIVILLQRLFARLHAPVAEFAAIEAGSKKHNMGNIVLGATCMTAATALFILGTSIIHASEAQFYDTDVIVINTGNQKKKDLLFLENLDGVTETEYIYQAMDKFIICGEETKTDLMIYALPDGTQFQAIHNLPETLNMNEMALDKRLANRYGMKEGGTYSITFRIDSMFPIEREMTVVCYIDSALYTGNGAFVISQELYQELYHNQIDSILLRTPNPDSVRAELDNILAGTGSTQTMEEYVISIKQENRQIREGLYTIIGVALLLTIIGISGNQIIGFESRRKEYALLHSTSMSRKQLSWLIVLENLIIFGISVLFAILTSIPVTLIISDLLDRVDAGIYITPYYHELAGFGIAVWFVMMLSAIVPLRMLNRMNTADEIKYE